MRTRRTPHTTNTAPRTTAPPRLPFFVVVEEEPRESAFVHLAHEVSRDGVHDEDASGRLVRRQRRGTPRAISLSIPGGSAPPASRSNRPTTALTTSP